MHLKIERDGVALFEGEVDTFEYSEKADGSVSVVGRPAPPQRQRAANGGGFADLLRGVSAASKRPALASIPAPPPENSESSPTSDETDPSLENEDQQT